MRGQLNAALREPRPLRRQPTARNVRIGARQVLATWTAAAVLVTACGGSRSEHTASARALFNGVNLNPDDRAAQEASITFLHVSGQAGRRGWGSSAVLAGPDFTVIIDAGHRVDDVHIDLLPVLRSLGVDQVDLIVGTHPHTDHIAQLPEMLEAFEVANVWMAGSHPYDLPAAHRQSATYDRVMATIASTEVDYAEPRAGEVHQFGSLQLEVLHPADLRPTHETDVELNNDSLVIRATYGDVSVLFTGDALRRAEVEMMSRGDVAADVLELGHHGADDATSRAWLEAVGPDVVVAGAASEDKPTDTVVDRVTTSPADLYVTGYHGHVTMTTDGTDLEVTTDADRDPIVSLQEWRMASRLFERPEPDDEPSQHDH